MSRWNKTRKILLILLSLLILVSVIVAVSASNIVSGSRADELERGITPNDLKPDECASLNLTNVIEASGPGITNGTPANDLILGTDKGEKIDGKGGNDCIIGGAGKDNLIGGAGDDILLGGPGKDKTKGKKGYDICYGGGGKDKPKDFDCEVVHIP